MTTTVTIEAHCDPETTRVDVQITDGENASQTVSIEDGETHSCVVYDDVKVTVSEVKK